MRRLVVDTNVMVSALLFRGPASRLVEAWRSGRRRLVMSPEILIEYAKVLAYPKFGISDHVVSALVRSSILPFADLVSVTPGASRCRDQDDDKFLWCAESSHADALVTGDSDLLALREQIVGLTILTLKEELAFDL